MERFERGEMDRSELHAMMALHARDLIREMEEDHRNPAAAFLERLIVGRHVRRLVRRHGARLVRECLVALSEVRDFPPADHLWNASHPDLPLHCFMRMRRRPMFRILSIHPESNTELRCMTEHGTEDGGKPQRTEWRMARDASWHLHAARA